MICRQNRDSSCSQHVFKYFGVPQYRNTEYTLVNRLFQLFQGIQADEKLISVLRQIQRRLSLFQRCHLILVVRPQPPGLRLFAPLAEYLSLCLKPLPFRNQAKQFIELPGLLQTIRDFFDIISVFEPFDLNQPALFQHPGLFQKL